MKKLIVAGFLVFSSFTIHAGQVIAKLGGTTVVTFGTVSRTGLLQAEFKTTSHTYFTGYMPRDGTPPDERVVKLHQVDCGDRRIKSITLGKWMSNEHRETGERIIEEMYHATNPSVELNIASYMYPVSGTVGEIMIKHACKQQKE